MGLMKSETKQGVIGEILSDLGPASILVKGGAEPVKKRTVPQTSCTPPPEFGGHLYHNSLTNQSN